MYDFKIKVFKVFRSEYRFFFMFSIFIIVNVCLNFIFIYFNFFEFEFGINKWVKLKFYCVKY